MFRDSKREEEGVATDDVRENESKKNILKTQDLSTSQQGKNQKEKSVKETIGENLNVPIRKRECRNGQAKEIKEKGTILSQKNGRASERERLGTDREGEQENLSENENLVEKQRKTSKKYESVEGLWEKEQFHSPKLSQAGQVLPKESWEVFCRNRPDLIREISVRVKESLTPESGRSCTDVSDPNASPSLSENSCASVDLRNAGKKIESLEKERLKQLLKEELKRKDVDNKTISSNDKDKEREEENEAGEKVKKKENGEEKFEKGSPGKIEGGGNESEMKGWKRTRMRLFDLGRKMALKQKEGKKVDGNTQTERRPTVRVKEQSVATEPVAPVEMRDWSCGVAFDADEYIKQKSTDSATQTVGQERAFEVSEAKWSSSEGEENFSEDSLDSKANERNLFKIKETCLKGKKKLRNQKVQTRNVKEKWEERENGMWSKWKGAQEPETGLYLFKLKAETTLDENSSERSSLDSLEENSYSEQSEKLLSENSDEDEEEEFLFFGNTPSNGETDDRNWEKERRLYTIAENSEGSEGSSSAAELNSFSTSFNSQNLAHARVLFSSFPNHQENQNSVKNKALLKEFKREKRGSSHERNTIADEHCGPTAQINDRQPTDFKKTFVSRAVGEQCPSWDGERSFPTNERQGKIKSKRDNGHRTQGSTKTSERSDVGRQSLKLKVPRNESGSNFSMTAQLLDDSLAKSETMFGSSESVTFFYMGPARSETSVLMEVIKKSLEGRCKSNERTQESEGEKYVTGTTLPRSVSVDTAVAALSRILGDQNEFKVIKKCSSLGTLREKGATSDLRERTLLEQSANKNTFIKKKTENTGLNVKQNSKENIQLKNYRERTETYNREENEKEYKEYESEDETVLKEGREIRKEWTRKPRRDFEGEHVKRDMGERRVKFFKSEQELRTREEAESLLREARDLLRALNIKCSELLEESAKNGEGGKSEIWNGERNFQRWREWEKDGNRLVEEEGDENLMKTDTSSSRAMFTWPRARNGKCGKPPLGTRRRGVRSRTEIRNERSGKIVDALRKDGRREPEEDHVWRVTENEDQIWEAEGEALEESWKRLLRAVEEDEAREKRCKRLEAEGTWVDRREERRGLARWEKSKCAGECSCEERRCASRVCEECGGSNPELEFWGAGARHCRDFCLRCRKAKDEAYRSTPQLNTSCSRERCRLRYYGFCPCSTATLSRVAPSPRAYMLHLLGLRRRILDRSRL